MWVNIFLICGSIILGITTIYFFRRNSILIKELLYYNNKINNYEHTINKLDISLKDTLAEKDKYELLALVTQQTESGIMLLNANADIIWVNNAFERMYEYKFTEFISTLGNNIRQTSFNPKITDRLNRCQNKFECVIYEALNVTKSGKKIWTHTSLIPLVKNGKLLGMATVDSDIHKRVVNSEHLIKVLEQINSQFDNLACEFEILHAETTELFQTISNSKQVIEKTDDIILHIKDISDKTKILGINASIEAHAAGNAGQGFRVIANEIVQISNNTINSVKEVNGMLDNLKNGYKQLRKDRKDTQSAFYNYQKLVSSVKTEMLQIINTLEDFKAHQ